MKIKFNPLDINSIDEAIEKIKSTEKAMRKIPREAMQELVDKGVKKAQELCPVYSGETLNSIHGYVDEEGNGKIVAGGNAAWIEFGTGIEGANSPFPGDPSVMAGATPYNGYMSGSKIFETEDGRIGWVYYDEKLKGWYFTEGMPSRPFMYYTAEYLREVAPEVFKVVIRETTRGK